MIIRTTLLVIIFFMSSCSDSNDDRDSDKGIDKDSVSSTSNNTLSGFWVESNGNSIAEFTNNKIIFTLLAEKNKQNVVDYESIDESRYHIKGIGMANSPVLMVDWNAKTLSVADIFNDKSDRKYIKAPNITMSDILGKWYSYEKDGAVEISSIATYKESSYDYESVELNHKKKTFSDNKVPDIKLSIQNGYIFNDPDPDTGEVYIYYLTSYSQNTMNFVDSDGYKWSQQRIENPELIKIPAGYKKIQ